MTLVEDLDRGGGKLHLDLLPGEPVGHRVVVLVDRDVVVDVHRCFLPVPVHARRPGQGAHRRQIDGLEELPAGGVHALHLPVVEPLQALSYREVGLGDGVEDPVS
jgi:hypothetical protein